MSSVVLRVGVYVDAFNVYYGGRDIRGRGSAGWRWLDVGSSAMGLIQPHWWPDSRLTRLVYCTVPRTREGDPSSAADQLTYVSALLRHRPETVVVNGRYAPRIKTGCWSTGPVPVLDGEIDAAVVLSNDGDLEFPLVHARSRVPVATVNPSSKPVVTALKGKPDCGAGRHWWRRLRAEDFRSNRLPEVVGRYRRPEGW